MFSGKPDIEVVYQPNKEVEIISKTNLTNEWQNRLPLSPGSMDIVIETKSEHDFIAIAFLIFIQIEFKVSLCLFLIFAYLYILINQ